MKEKYAPSKWLRYIMLTKELIERYFSDKCSAEERELVSNFFKTNPGILEKYLTEDDWEHFKPIETLNSKISRRILNKVNNETVNKSGGIKIIYKIAVAASVILLVAGGWFFLGNKTNGVHLTARSKVATQVVLVQRSNTTAKVIQLKLDDSSSVALEPGSTIMFYQPFLTTNKRDVFLTGKASFKVAKDKSKPFTVVADGIATTALGTYFTVSAFDTSLIISVALHEGKVVVRSSDSLHKKLDRKIFLLPGDEMIFYKRTLLANVEHNKNVKMVAAASAKELRHAVKKPDWYVFKSASISQVLNQLSTYYQVAIYYYPGDLENRYYSGRIEKGDSLDDILKDIALLNRFAITRKDGAYFIQKRIR